MARRAVFDDWRSWLHFSLGILAAASCRLRLPYLSIVSLALLALFIYWELRERENGLNKLGDFIELLTGFVVGSVALSL